MVEGATDARHERRVADGDDTRRRRRLFELPEDAAHASTLDAQLIQPEAGAERKRLHCDVIVDADGVRRRRERVGGAQLRRRAVVETQRVQRHQEVAGKAVTTRVDVIARLIDVVCALYSL